MAAYLVAHGPCLQQSLTPEGAEGLVAVHQCDLFTQADQAQQPERTHPGRKRTLGVDRASVQVVHLEHNIVLLQGSQTTIMV